MPLKICSIFLSSNASKLSGDGLVSSQPGGSGYSRNVEKKFGDGSKSFLFSILDLRCPHQPSGHLDIGRYFFNRLGDCLRKFLVVDARNRLLRICIR